MNANSKRITQLDKVLLGMALYYEREMDDALVNIYHELLAEYDIEDIKAACNIWMKTQKWFPKASELIEIINNNRGAAISIESRAQQQWRHVVSMVRARGLTRGKPIFADPITEHLVRTQFRWSYLCGIEEAKENWEEKRWCEAYDLAAEIHKNLLTIEVPKQVSGLLDRIMEPIKEFPLSERRPANPELLEKMRAYRKMLEKKANKDVEDLEESNRIINLRLKRLQNQGKQLMADEERNQPDTQRSENVSI